MRAAEETAGCVLDSAIDEPQDMFAAPGCKEVLEVIGEVLERDGRAA